MCKPKSQLFHRIPRLYIVFYSILQVYYIVSPHVITSAFLTMLLLLAEDICLPRILKLNE